MSGYNDMSNEKKILPSISTKTVVSLSLSPIFSIQNPSCLVSYNFILSNLP